MGYGTVIREARKRVGITQEGLSIKVGCSRTTVCDWEKEKYAPTDAKNIAALETALELKSGHLYNLIYGNPSVAPRLSGAKQEDHKTA